MSEIIEYIESDLAFDEAISILTLTTSIWPKTKSVEQLAKELIDSAADGGDDQPATRFTIWEEGKIIAHARTFVREIFWQDRNDAAFQSMKVLALAAVCTEPAYRAQGLGVAIITRAFDQIDSDVRASLFQTGVARFYEKIGCRVVQNKFVNRKNLENPHANPWWDKQVMIYPADAHWPDGVIDMNGPGY